MNLSRFLPTLARETLEKEMSTIGILSNATTDAAGNDAAADHVTCAIDDGVLTIGRTSTKIYNPATKTKIPETLFYDTNQNKLLMEALLRDFLIGEHLLLIGNQVRVFAVELFSRRRFRKNGIVPCK